MITQAFDSRTMAKMKEALERACLLLPTGGEHSARRMIANKIIECAQRGNTSLSELTEAGYSASLQLTASADRAAAHDISSSGALGVHARPRLVMVLGCSDPDDGDPSDWLLSG